jgi:hypothetical protein
MDGFWTKEELSSCVCLCGWKLKAERPSALDYFRDEFTTARTMHSLKPCQHFNIRPYALSLVVIMEGKHIRKATLSSPALDNSQI